MNPQPDDPMWRDCVRLLRDDDGVELPPQSNRVYVKDHFINWIEYDPDKRQICLVDFNRNMRIFPNMSQEDFDKLKDSKRNTVYRIIQQWHDSGRFCVRLTRRIGAETYAHTA